MTWNVNSVASAFIFRGFRTGAPNLKRPKLGQKTHTELHEKSSGTQRQIRDTTHWHADANDEQLDPLCDVMVVLLGGTFSSVGHSL